MPLPACFHSHDIDEDGTGVEANEVLNGGEEKTTRTRTRGEKDITHREREGREDEKNSDIEVMRGDDERDPSTLSDEQGPETDREGALTEVRSEKEEEEQARQQALHDQRRKEDEENEAAVAELAVRITEENQLIAEGIRKSGETITRLIALENGLDDALLWQDKLETGLISSFYSRYLDDYHGGSSGGGRRRSAAHALRMAMLGLIRDRERQDRDRKRRHQDMQREAAVRVKENDAVIVIQAQGRGFLRRRANKNPSPTVVKATTTVREDGKAEKEDGEKGGEKGGEKREGGEAETAGETMVEDEGSARAEDEDVEGGDGDISGERKMELTQGEHGEHDEYDEPASKTASETPGATVTEANETKTRGGASEGKEHKEETQQADIIINAENAEGETKTGGDDASDAAAIKIMALTNKVEIAVAAMEMTATAFEEASNEREMALLKFETIRQKQAVKSTQKDTKLKNKENKENKETWNAEKKGAKEELKRMEGVEMSAKGEAKKAAAAAVTAQKALKNAEQELEALRAPPVRPVESQMTDTDLVGVDVWARLVLIGSDLADPPGDREAAEAATRDRMHAVSLRRRRSTIARGFAGGNTLDRRRRSMVISAAGMSAGGGTSSVLGRDLAHGSSHGSGGGHDGLQDTDWSRRRRHSTVTMALGELPDGWVEYADEEGTGYYYNVLTEESQWERPASIAIGDATGVAGGSGAGRSGNEGTAAKAGLGMIDESPDSKLDRAKDTDLEGEQKHGGGKGRGRNRTGGVVGGGRGNRRRSTVRRVGMAGMTKEWRSRRRSSVVVDVLDHGWQELEDDEGQNFFINTDTMEGQWVRPDIKACVFGDIDESEEDEESEDEDDESGGESGESGGGQLDEETETHEHGNEHAHEKTRPGGMNRLLPALPSPPDVRVSATKAGGAEGVEGAKGVKGTESPRLRRRLEEAKQRDSALRTTETWEGH
jgi:hypothetical protein